MRYRSEIDGLRTLAVVPVILFHAGLPFFSGGFVGVDIFFVISGFLITSIIVEDLEKGQFSIATFYERRARRILPALFFVMAFCFAAAWVLLIPSELEELSESIIGVMLFSSNILFWQTSGYFETEVDLKPLLHTWSLSVEEQYYVFFPLLLLLLWRFGRRSITYTICATVIASLMLAHLGATHKPIATFYLLPTRAWELGIGALAALHLTAPGRRSPSDNTSQLLSFLGFGMILFSILAYDKHTPFPSLYALVPVLGTAFIILYAHPGTVIGALLATRPFVWIGLISYSAYLWHQPLFALERHRSIAEPGIQVMLGLALFSLIMGYLSWRWIEAPFRNKKKISRRQIFGLSAVGMAAFLSIGLAGVASDGFRSRDKWAGVAGAFATQAERGSGTRYCTANRVVSTLGELVCVIGDNAKKPEGVLWGDSYAGALVHGLDNELRRQGKAFYVVLSDGCVPVENAWRIALQADFNCTKDRHNTFMRAVLADASIEKIVWVGAFHLLLDPSQSFEYVIDGRPISGQTAKKRMLKMLSSFKGFVA